MPETSHDSETRVEDYARESNPLWVTNALISQRDEILRHWLEATAAQPFHEGRRERVIADHIPQLFDALMEFLQSTTPRSVDPRAPLDDSAIREAARNHALARVRQGLQPADVLVEFRLLRQELWHALRLALPESAPSGDVVAAELLVNDALDGAAAIALSILTAQLEQVREEFLAKVLHEVRQPVTNIKGFIQLAQRFLERSPPDLSRAIAALKEGGQATDRMNRALDSLVDASRAALDALGLRQEFADIVAIIHSVVTQLGAGVTERVSLENSASVVTTGYWDTARLTQVISNLVSNAAKYSPPHTPIRITIEDEADLVVVGVRDQGMGIPVDDLPRLFERYVRGRNAIDQGLDGLGLGLYLCRGIIEAHGGRIWAMSPGPGQGTTIFFALPRCMALVPSCP